MRQIQKEMPRLKPEDPRFSSGPVKKFKGWTLSALENAVLGRSHRSVLGQSKIRDMLEKTRRVLEVPDTHKIALIPGSDTGAVETAIWNLIGERGVDIAAWEKFGLDWVRDIKQELRLDDVRFFKAEYGHLPDLSEISGERDLIFTWNGTTSGVRVPNADFIEANRTGLVICDATSAAFAQRLDWNKLDAITYSWQKVLGGEAAHGILILSPRALERLSRYRPKWPIPKLMRLCDETGLIEALFEGYTLNTPSLLCIEDQLQTLDWIEQNGGLDKMVEKADYNKSLIDHWVEQTGWVEHMCLEDKLRSNTGLCLKIADSEIKVEFQEKIIKKMAALLADKNVAYDIVNHREAPASLRIWCGGTVEADDIHTLLPWLDWAFYQAGSV